MMLIERLAVVKARRRDINRLERQLEDSTPIAENNGKLISLSEQLAESASPEKSADGSWRKVDRALRRGVSAASAGDDLDALERLMNKQIDAARKSKAAKK